MKNNYEVVYRDSEKVRYLISEKVLTISIEDEPFFLSKNWCWRKGQLRKDVYYLVGCQSSFHRIIMNAKKGELVDHINRDTTDCSRGNLRIATLYENGLNRSDNQNKKSKLPRGVTEKKYNGRVSYHSRISIRGKMYHIGYFDTPEEAHNAFLLKTKERESLYREINLIK